MGKHPTATDELGLSENSAYKLMAYGEGRICGRVRKLFSLDMVISHDDFEELLKTLDSAFGSCSEALMAHSCGETEASGNLGGTRWTVITSAQYAQYLVYRAQQIFNRIISVIAAAVSMLALPACPKQYIIFSSKMYGAGFPRPRCKGVPLCPALN